MRFAKAHFLQMLLSVHLVKIAKHNKKGDGWMDVGGRVNVSKFLSQHPWQRVDHLGFAESDSTTEFNMIYLLNGDQKHASDVSASCHGQGRCGCQFRGLERLLLTYGVKGEVTASVAWHPRVWSCCAALRQCHLSCGERCVAGRGRAMMRGA